MRNDFHLVAETPRGNLVAAASQRLGPSHYVFDFGFTVAGLLFEVAIGIWTSLRFFYGHDGTLGQRVSDVFMIAGIILVQVVRYQAGQNKDDEPAP